MSAPVPLVEQVGTDDVLALRAAVLRRDTPSSEPRFPEDDMPGTFHLAVRAPDGAVIATSTWLPRAFPPEPHLPGVQVRGMATAPEHRGAGLGSTLVAAGLDAARGQGAALVWARARDEALEFYRRVGFVVVGEGFVDATTALPHHLVVRYL